MHAKLILTLTERGQDEVTREEAAEILGSTPSNIRNLLSHLTAKGWLERLGDGRYLVVPPAYGAEPTGDYNVLALASASVPKGYVGWWNAASLHGFTTQVPNAVTMATLRRHRPRVLAGSEVRYVPVSPEKFFGFEKRQVLGRSVTVSDKEKTVADCVDRPDLCGGPSEVCRIVWGASFDIDWERLVDYVSRIGSISLIQRLGFVCDLVEATVPPPIRDKLRETVKAGYRSHFGPREKVEGVIGFVPDWGISVSLTKQQLLGDVPRKREIAP
ncbi:type IV toxin-antitoxin system AbiEi family antitoxin domain-containing protein [Acidisphaera sp. S103]|uniref:type IV toxin-antitoxin system AbiEi family antitoxin domain-containing protein n=1 Tax=Acidisphaera sp. S103 TaxID=1747223 RepID=UPI00131C46F5|nr:type IV toxin-antitoxin system AbiEi family antitoxin domain-containing protein [Acidisphaera sp. S103]